MKKKFTQKQIIARKRNWEKGRMLGMKTSLSTMMNDEQAFTYVERQQLTGIHNRVKKIVANWKNKR